MALPVHDRARALRVARWRMYSVRLAGARFSAPEDAVGWLGAVQSQDYGPAKWSVAARCAGADDAALERAFNDGRLLRTHVLRPTWHFVRPEDIRWLLTATAPRIHALNAYMYRQVGMDDDARRKALHVIERALRGGNHLTRKEVGAVLERAGISTEGYRLAYTLMHAELEALVCSGPRKGRQHTYALVDERAPSAGTLDPDDALAELTRRYFTSHGPATTKDFQSWSSLTMAEIRRGLEMAGGALASETIDDSTYWFGEPPPEGTEVAPRVRLLQGYDEYVMGYSHTRRVLDVDGRVPPPSPTSRPAFVGVVLLDSQVAGHWKATPARTGVRVDVALYDPFGQAETAALQSAADEYGTFLGVPASVVHVTG